MKEVSSQGKLQDQLSMEGQVTTCATCKDCSHGNLKELLAAQEYEVATLLSDNSKMKELLASKEDKLASLFSEHNKMKELLASKEDEVTDLHSCLNKLENLLASKEKEVAALSSGCEKVQRLEVCILLHFPLTAQSVLFANNRNLSRLALPRSRHY